MPAHNSQFSLDTHRKSNALSIFFIFLLLSEGADINARDESGVTVLHTPALAGRKDTVALLIAKGAHIDARNKNGLTPLDTASQRGHQSTVELLGKYVNQ